MSDIFQSTRIIVSDIETTDNNVKFAQIAEFGAVEYVNGELKREKETLFRGGRSHPFLIKNIHRIKDRDRKTKPYFKQSAFKICDFLSNAILVGHNFEKFDLVIIKRDLAEEGLELVNFKVIDTLKIARKYFKDRYLNNQLGTIAAFHNLEYGNHRALGDAKTNFEVFKIFMKELNVTDINDFRC